MAVSRKNIQRRAERWRDRGDERPMDHLLVEAEAVERRVRARARLRRRAIQRTVEDLRRADAISSEGALRAIAARLYDEERRRAPVHTVHANQSSRSPDERS